MIFVTFKLGLAQHASGKGTDGEAAVKAVLGWQEGEYRFIEDVMPDEEDFPVNVPAAIAAALGAGEGEALDEALAKGAPLPVLAVGESKPTPPAETAGELFDLLEKENFTGCCAVGPAEARMGLFVFVEGAPAGGIMWARDSYRRGEEATAALEKSFGKAKGSIELFGTREEVATTVAVAFGGDPAIARLPSAAINMEEYLSWVRGAGITGLVSIIAGDKGANILIKNGYVLGAVVAPDTTLSTEADEALALFYARGATVEAYVSKTG
jgi:hypothetical protein